MSPRPERRGAGKIIPEFYLGSQNYDIERAGTIERVMAEERRGEKEREKEGEAGLLTLASPSEGSKWGKMTRGAGSS